MERDLLMSDFLVSELIRKKRDGETLNEKEISFLVKGFATGSIPDYQITAWLMASYLKGMNHQETFELTRGIKNSGASLNWRNLEPSFRDCIFADKHSTGGVGDKVSLILVPLAVHLGMKVPMMSGRSLGHTGGTVDKLQSIDGFNMYPSEACMIRGLKDVGSIMMAQRDDLCPADRKLYSLRDVTATVDNYALITASIVSKKWAEGVDAIVFDVKAGSAAFMKNIEAARELSRWMVETAKLAGLKAKACITRMEDPLGCMIGNTCEILETIWILKNEYPSETHRELSRPLAELSARLAAEMAVLSGTEKDVEAAYQKSLDYLSSGAAFENFARMCHNQEAKLDWEKKLSLAPHVFEIKASESGFIKRIDSLDLGLMGIELKMGRAQAEDRIQHAVSIETLVQPGSKINSGDPLMKIYLENKEDFKNYEKRLQDVFEIQSEAVSFHGYFEETYS